MTKKSVLILFFLLASVIGLSAQSPAEIWKTAYQQAKSNQWSDVVSTLKPHIFPPPDDSLAPALLQLYALASWRNSDYASAIVTIEKIETDYRTWKEFSETLYLKGEIFWKKNRFEEAWSCWITLDSQNYLGRIRNTTKTSFQKVPPDLLSGWKTISPFRSVAIFSQWLAGESTSTIVRNTSLPKIGIVLPFQLKESQKSKTSNAPMDFYRGMLLANEVCTASDSGLEFHVFDSKGSVQEIESMISKNTFSGLNALVGPLKFSHLKPLKDGANQLKIPLFNPLSNQTISETTASYFGLQPGFSTLAKECFSFISQHSSGSRYAIIYGPEKNDSLLADAYREHLKKMGRQLKLFKKVGKNSAANLTKFLVEAGLDSTDHVFVANNEPLVRVQLLSSYGWMKSKYPILVYGKWLEASNPDFQEFTRNPIYFADPDLPDHAIPHWKEWESSYIAKWGTPPNWVAWKGFDFARTLSRLWYNSDKGFANSLSGNVKLNSDLFGGYQFNPIQADNQFVPIYKVEKEGLKRVWPQ
ncbi:MAG TPA: ABC transporter substrate-binding protein [Catalimonadaceae bacterium]|nr:ABC transporter substrate-binding protein [Catalimonadaceae bacterium]